MKKNFRILLVLISFLTTGSITFAEETLSTASGEKLLVRSAHLYNENAVKSFVCKVFSFHDEHVPVERFLLLIDEAILMRFPDITIRNHSDFKAWYKSIEESFESTRHTIRSIEVSYPDKGNYALTIRLSWQGKTKEGNIVSSRSLEKWTLAEDPQTQELKIKTYLVTEDKN